MRFDKIDFTKNQFPEKLKNYYKINSEEEANTKRYSALVFTRFIVLSNKPDSFIRQEIKQEIVLRCL